jgi:hypothetical protein
MPGDDRRRARLAWIVSFSSFFVFPAVPIGRTGALTVPFFVAALLAAAWVRRLRVSEWWPFAWMLVPMVISGTYVLLAGSALVPGIVPKAAVALAMPLVVLIPARRLLREGQGEPFVLGAACAILVHAAVGAYQVVAFERGLFPFAGLMATNPGMAMPASEIQTYVDYVQRPFGLFAEPSAMAACVGPWLVVITNTFFAPPRAGARRLATTLTLGLAIACGMALVVASKSGLAVPIAAAVAVTAVSAGLSWRLPLRTRAAALLVGLMIAGTSAVWLNRTASARLDLAHNDSWQGRLESLKLGARSVSASLDSSDRALVGIGPGQAYAQIQSTALKYEAGGGVVAVWSVGLTYAMETGLVGIVALLVLAAAAVGSIWSSRARLAGLLCAGVWVTGVGIGTSYAGQPALWTALATLLTWRSVGERS